MFTPFPARAVFASTRASTARIRLYSHQGLADKSTAPARPAHGSLEALNEAVRDYLLAFKYKQLPMIEVFQEKYKRLKVNLKKYRKGDPRKASAKERGLKGRLRCLDKLKSTGTQNSKAVAATLRKATKCALEYQLRCAERCANNDSSRVGNTRRPGALELRITRLRAEIMWLAMDQDLNKWDRIVAEAKRRSRVRLGFEIRWTS